MSATERLRRLLDERGVEWVNIRNNGSESDYLTEWQFDGIEGHAIATEWAVGQHLTVCIAHPMTPEQAIAATLGDADLEAENAKLREQVERLQPKDCEGNALDIADTVSMLRSEYDGDHEWDDVVVELALTKWGGDRWIVRGSKGEAWACDCLKTGYDEDAYEGSDDAEPIANPTLMEVENAKLRELLVEVLHELDKVEENVSHGWFWEAARELGVEVDG